MVTALDHRLPTDFLERWLNINFALLLIMAFKSPSPYISNTNTLRSSASGLLHTDNDEPHCLC